MSNKNIPVFVYGTLLSRGSNPAAKKASATVVCPATIYGSIYDLGWYPGLNLRLGNDDKVTGEIILVDQEGLEELDTYEGAPILYSRVRVLATTDFGEDREVFTYVYNGNIPEEYLIPHGDWILHCQKERNTECA